MNNSIKKYLDITICLLLFSACFYFGILHINSVGQGDFYQSEFAPAVLWSCGKGFKQINGFTQSPSMLPFLTKKTPSFNCAELPKNLSTTTPDVFQYSERYLMMSAAIVWRITGISWSHLNLLFGFFFAMSIVSLYAIFRLGMGVPLSFFSVLLILYLGMIEYYLPQLRDFSKAPFILPLVFILGLIVKYKVSAKMLYTMAFSAGTLVGIGFGFRSDLLIYMPVFILTLLFFTPYRFQGDYRLKLTAIAIYLLPLLVFTLPIFLHLGGNAFAHVILLGFSDNFTNALGIQNSPIYSFVYVYNDALIFSTVAGYGYSILHVNHQLIPLSKEFSKISDLYLLKLLLNFPADMLIRTYASILNILSMPYVEIAQRLHITLTPLHTNILKCLAVIVAILSLAHIKAYNTKVALFVLFMTLFLAAYPVLQFAGRHYFCLEFISIWFIGFLLQLHIHKLTRLFPKIKDYQVQ